MMHILFGIAIIVASVASTPTFARGQEQEVIAGGELEFHRSCATCHGRKGKGNGPMAAMLIIKPADLTGLSKRNGGEFPFWRVYGIIDGRQRIQSHGPSEMPVWGERFKSEAVDKRADNRSLVAGRILGLVFYLRHIQE